MLQIQEREKETNPVEKEIYSVHFFLPGSWSKQTFITNTTLCEQSYPFQGSILWDE
jgi:hypothetical protein